MKWVHANAFGEVGLIEGPAAAIATLWTLRSH
jgi:hypothetical protein